MTQLLLTAVGVDRPGFVAAMSTTVAEHGGNWLGSRMARLAGAFAGIVLVDVPADHVSDLSTALDELASQGVRITITSTDEASEPDQLVLVRIGRDFGNERTIAQHANGLCNSR